jgi:hypothetical protein
VVAETAGLAPVQRGEADLGTCYALDGEGVRVLAEMPPGTPAIGLPPGRYQFKCLLKQRLSLAQAEVPAGGLRLEQLTFTPEQPTYALAKGPGTSGRSVVSIAAALEVSDEWRFTPGLFAGYRRETDTSGFDLQVGADLHSGDLQGLLGLSVRLPWLDLGPNRLDLGLTVGADVNPFHGTVDAGLLLGPTLRFELPLDDRASLFALLIMLTRVDFETADVALIGLASAGFSWDLTPP